MKRTIWLASALALGGCANLQPVQAPAGAVDALKGQPLTIATYGMPNLQGTTWGGVAVGAGAICSAICADGGAIVRDNEIRDPVLTMAPKLTAVVSEKLKPSGTARIADRPRNLDDEASLSRDAGGKGVVLDITTVDWSFIYYPLDWTHYELRYTARARLIDANTGKRIAQAPCQYKSPDTDPPSYDQMLENKAARLKAMLALAGETCANQMAKSLYAP